jgi:hypothetical protein
MKPWVVAWVFWGFVSTLSPAVAGEGDFRREDILLARNTPASSTQLSDSLSSSYAYPVPFVPSQGDDRITFANIAPESQVHILAEDGCLVRMLQGPDDVGRLVWDARNEQGEAVASGVYFYQVRRGRDVQTGKLLVIK